VWQLWLASCSRHAALPVTLQPPVQGYHKYTKEDESAKEQQLDMAAGGRR
jgi:hypothetical protein